MINDATPDIVRTLHTFIERIGCPGQRVGCPIYAEEANAMMERLSNALHLKTATVAMSLSQTILKNRCINQLFYNQEKVDTSTTLFSECILKCYYQALVCEVAVASKRFRSGVRKENVATGILNIPTMVTYPFRQVYSGYDTGRLTKIRENV